MVQYLRCNRIPYILSSFDKRPPPTVDRRRTNCSYNFRACYNNKYTSLLVTIYTRALKHLTFINWLNVFEFKNVKNNKPINSCSILYNNYAHICIVTIIIVRLSDNMNYYFLQLINRKWCISFFDAPILNYFHAISIVVLNFNWCF